MKKVDEFMTIVEKVSYLKGLAEGLGLDDSKNDKLIKTIIDILDDIALSIDDVEDGMVEMSEQLDAVDEDLADLEEFVFDDDDEDDDDDDDDDDEFFQVTCPNCGEDIYLDADTLELDGIDCPACGTNLEFEIDDECECEDCESESKD